MACCCEDKQNRVWPGAHDEEMTIAAKALIALGAASRDAVCRIIPPQSQLGTGPEDDACGVLVFSSGCSASAHEKQTRLDYGQEVYVPTKWINAEHLKGTIEGFSYSGNHMLVNLSQVLRVPPRAQLLIESEEENFDQEELWTEDSQQEKRKTTSVDAQRKPKQHHSSDDPKQFQVEPCTEGGEMQPLAASPVARSRISRDDPHRDNDLWIDELDCYLQKEHRSNCPTSSMLGNLKIRRSTKSRFHTRQLKCLEGVEKIAEQFKVNYREVVRTVRDAVYWLKRAWMVVKHGKIASYFALERLVQAVQGAVKVKNSYSCKRQECLRMIVWCFVLGPDRLRRNWNLFDPDRLLHEGLLYSSKKVGGLLGIAGEFRKWERKEGYIDCRQDRERGAMVYEDEYVINHFEARYGPVDAYLQLG